MKAPKRLQQLVAEIIDEFPQAKIEFDPLLSGVCWLNVWLGRRNFEMEFNPARGTGVSENFKETPPFVGHDAAFESLDEAVGNFKSMLANAANTEADYLPRTPVLREEGSPWKENK